MRHHLFRPLIISAVALGMAGGAQAAVPLLVDATYEQVVRPAIVIRADRTAAMAQFEAFDDDEDGLLSKQEAEDLPGVEESVYGADDFARIDTNSDGDIDFQEFATYLSSGRSELTPLVSTDTDIEDADDDRPGRIDDIDVDDLADEPDDDLGI